MENALYDFHSLVDTYQKTHSFAALTRSFSDTTQLVNKNRTRAFSMKYSLYLIQTLRAKNRFLFLAKKRKNIFHKLHLKPWSTNTL